MIAPASPLRLHRQPSIADIVEDSWARALAGRGTPVDLRTRLNGMAGALFLMVLTAVSGSALYAFSRGPSAAPLVSVSSH